MPTVFMLKNSHLCDKLNSELFYGRINMAVLKCKMCGGDLSISDGLSVCECDYCGTKQTVPQANDEKKIKLFDRANRLRLLNEFDKSYGVYETIVQEFPKEAEAYWGLVLCKYGIEYVDDPKTLNKIPTCHRSSFDSIFDDNNFDLTLKYSDALSREIYKSEAKTIEEIRRSIVEISSKEEPYDIFICYKETDKKGDRTIDSVIAQDTYNRLIKEGYRVFFARISLEDKLGREYEPYIFSALHSSKVMLVFGTDYEHFNAVWVKNEWSRFLKLVEQDSTRVLIPCFKGIDAYDMPKEFFHLQAQDMGKIGAMQDLIHGIGKIIAKKEADRVILSPSDTSFNTLAKPLVERGYSFLKLGNYDRANDSFEKALDYEPENEQALLGVFFTKCKVGGFEELSEFETFDVDEESYSMLMSVCSQETKAKIENCFSKIENNILSKARHLIKSFKTRDEAFDCYNTVLDYNPKNEEALFDVFFAKCNVFDLEDLSKAGRFDFDKDSYDKLISVCSKETEDKLNEYFDKIENTFLQKARRLSASHSEDYSVIIYCYQKVLEFSPESEEALLGLLLAENHSSNFEELGKETVRFTNSETYKKLISICDEKTKNELQICSQQIEKNIEAKKERENEQKKKIKKKIIIFAASILLFFVGIIIGINVYHSTNKYIFGAVKIEGGYEITALKTERFIEDNTLIIPDKIGGKPVVSIGDYAFKDCNTFSKVQIPDTVTNIGKQAFYSCNSLTDIVIPDSVESIGDYAFSGCFSLKSITVGKGVSNIGVCVFASCDNIESATLSFSADGISGVPFGYLFGAPEEDPSANEDYVPRSIKTVIIPDGSVSDFAFRNCTHIATVIIGYDVTSIGIRAFYNCSSLKNVTLGSNLKSINYCAFAYCFSLSNIFIPANVTTIDNFVFEECPSLAIYCEAESQPSGWSYNWNYSKCPVMWGILGTP